MKHAIRLSALCCALLAPIALQAQTTDTVVVKQAHEVVIVTNDSLHAIHIKGQGSDTTYRYNSTFQTSPNASARMTQSRTLDFTSLTLGSRSSGRTSTDIAVTICPRIGFVTALGAPTGLDIDVAGSKELALDNVLTYRITRYQSPHAFSVNFGLNWKNFRMTDRLRFLKGTDGTTALANYPAGTEPKFSRLKVFSLTLSFLYHHRVSRNVKFSVGPMLNFNTYGSLKTRYFVEGHKEKEMQKDLHLSPVTIDLMAQVKLYGIGLYVKYSPCQTFKSNYGPKFTSLSFGVYF